jgi:DNA polymerase I-like protein with 3'-5' exonuclease and polymerase domains
VALDVETRDEQLRDFGVGVRRGGYVVGYAYAIEGGPSGYLPTRHFGGGNLPEENVLAYLRDQAKTYKGEIVGANFGYDLDYLWENKVELAPRRFRDVQVAACLVDELQDSYSLESIAKRCGLPGKDEGALVEAAKAHGVDPKMGLWKLHSRHVGPYATRDAVLALEVMAQLDKEIEAQEIDPIWDLESRLLPVLVKVRRRGVRVSFERLEKVERFCLEEESNAYSAIKAKTNVRLAMGDCNKSEAMAKVLREIGIKPELTPKTKKPKITADFLKSIHHPVAELMLRARKVNKVRTTFVQSIRDHAVGDRIHCTFNQVRKTEDYGDDGEEEQGPAFGRVSAVDPNLQQQPARDPELGPMWRQVYVADEGGEWCCADYSQQEPRWTIHYAEACGCSGAREAAGAFRADPRIDNYVLLAKVVHGEAAWAAWDKAEQKKVREPIKQTWLGLSYGMGAAKLCRRLGLATEWKFSERRGQMVEVAGPEGQALFDLFNSKAPFLKELANLAQNKARRVGHIRTVLGRRCRFPLVDGQYEWCHKALNRVIQGSSADQMKKAMVDADDAGVRLLLQVHDELDLTVWDRKEGEKLSEIMVAAAPCSVPHVVDLEFGKSWGGK